MGLWAWRLARPTAQPPPPPRPCSRPAAVGRHHRARGPAVHGIRPVHVQAPHLAGVRAAGRVLVWPRAASGGRWQAAQGPAAAHAAAIVAAAHASAAALRSRSRAVLTLPVPQRAVRRRSCAARRCATTTSAGRRCSPSSCWLCSHFLMCWPWCGASDAARPWPPGAACASVRRRLRPAAAAARRQDTRARLRRAPVPPMPAPAPHTAFGSLVHRPTSPVSPRRIPLGSPFLRHSTLLIPGTAPAPIPMHPPPPPIQAPRTVHCIAGRVLCTPGFSQPAASWTIHSRVSATQAGGGSSREVSQARQAVRRARARAAASS